MTDRLAQTIAWVFWLAIFPFLVASLAWFVSGSVEHFIR